MKHEARCVKCGVVGIYDNCGDALAVIFAHAGGNHNYKKVGDKNE